MGISWAAPWALCQKQVAEARTGTNPHSAHSSLKERAELEAILYRAGEEFQPALAFSLDGTVSLSVSCGYLGFRGSQGKHSAGKTEPLQTEMGWISGLTLAGTEGSTGKCKPRGSRWVFQPVLNPWWETPCPWGASSQLQGWPASLGRAGHWGWVP